MTESAAGARRWVLSHLRGEWPAISAGAGIMAARACVLLVLPWPLKFIVDSVIYQRPLGAWLATLLPDPATHRLALLDLFGGAMLLLGLLDALLVYVGNRLFMGAGQRAAFAVRRDFFAHLQRLPLDFHRRHMSGEIVSRLSDDVKALQDFVVALGIDLLPHVLTIGGVVVVMIAMNWRYGLVTLSVAPLLYLTARHYADRIRGAVRGLRESEGAQWGSTQEILGMVQLVHAFAREDHEDRRFEERSRVSLAAGLRASRIQSEFGPAMNLIIAVATGGIAWYGAVLVIRGELTAGELLVFLAYLRAIATPARQLAKAGRVFGRAAVAMERVAEYRAERSPIADAADAVEPAECAGRVQVRGVSFGYRPDQAVLRDVSFDLEPGKIVALVGATGAGKSTVAALVSRFFEPTLGRILLDGHDLRDLRLKYLRSRIALVPQEPMLFQAPLWMNIAYGRDGATRQDAIAAAVAAGVDDVIGRLTGGYDAIVGERGLSLSGGQRQCVAVARAMLSGAPVVILDEPSSNLDAGTEQRLTRALRLLAKDRSALVIAHRLATVMDVDLILVLDQGRIVQRGTHKQLLAQGGIYSGLWRASAAAAPGDVLRLIAS